jgi:hypothetical protein
MADDFFQRFSSRFGPAIAAEGPAAASATEVAATEASANETERRQMNPMLWVIVLGLAAALLFYLANR